ncbi:MAG: Tfx family DNA-binding protein [Methanothrix sp.]
MDEIDDKSESEDDESLSSFLTERQSRVLQMRLCGLSQQEAADRLGTTRSNISILEKRARQNIARAEKTLRQWMMLRAPISLKAAAGTDVFDLPGMIFAAADEKGIKLPITSLDIIEQLQRRSPRPFKKRTLKRDAHIYVTEEGEVLVEDTKA